MASNQLGIYCPHCHVPIRLTVERTEASAPVTWTCPRCRKSGTNDLGGQIVRITVRYEDKTKR
jgi:hypothetical protein